MIYPCLRCGACCAHFRVAFHWSEADFGLGGVVPVELTEKLDAHRLAMRGTWASVRIVLRWKVRWGKACVAASMRDARPFAGTWNRHGKTATPARSATTRVWRTDWNRSRRRIGSTSPPSTPRDAPTASTHRWTHCIILKCKHELSKIILVDIRDGDILHVAGRPANHGVAVPLRDDLCRRR